MKKTVTINLNGIIFHIDEDAHDQLNNYLTKIKSYFNVSEGKDEIMADIEARIAEMFQEKINNNKEVITLEDVEQVIKLMGKPEDYIDTGKTDQNNKAQNESEQEYSSGSRRHRLFRDKDNNVLGGVCSGIAAYFNFDPIWLRIAFAVSFFAFGTGFLLYLLLWIIIPAAKTTAEKLEMKGEKVNISNIEKSIKEEMENLKKKFNDFKEEARDAGKKVPAQKVKGILDKVIDFIANLATFVVKTVAKLIGLVFVAIGIVLIIMLLSSLFGTSTIWSITPSGVFTVAGSKFIEVFFVTEKQFTLSSLALLLLIGIPLISLVYNGIKMLLGIKKHLKGLGHLALALWIAGCILLGYVGIQIADDFSKKGVAKKSVAIPNPPGNTLYLAVAGDEYDDSDYDSKIVFGDWNCYFNEDQEINFGQTRLQIEKSETDSFEIQMIYSARGKSRKEAVKRAENINYGFSQKDSLLQFNPYFLIPNGEKWRDQRVQILVKVPLKASVYLTIGMERIIFDVDNVSETSDWNMVGKTWTMLDNGLSSTD